jgi:hypothetical protein
VADIVELCPAQDAIEEHLNTHLWTRVASLIARALVEDAPIRTDLLLAEMQTVARAVGLSRARSMLLMAWSVQIELMDDSVKTAAHELREAGVVDPFVERIDKRTIRYDIAADQIAALALAGFIDPAKRDDAAEVARGVGRVLEAVAAEVRRTVEEA